MRKWLLIIGVVVIALGALAALLLLRKSPPAGSPVGPVSSAFPKGNGPLVFPSQTNPNTPITGTGASATGTLGPTGLTGSEAPGTTSAASPYTDSQKTPQRISASRVAQGEIAVGSVKGLDLFVRYLEAGTGNIYDYRPVGGSNTRVSNATIPRVAETFWGKGGQAVLIRYFDETGGVVKNYLAKIASSASSTLSGSFLSDRLIEAAVAPNGERIGYVLALASGAKVVTSDFNNKNIVNNFASVFWQWRLLWPNKDSLVLVSAPASGVAGYAYQLTGGRLKPILWDINGLTVLPSPNLNWLIYSQSSPQGLRSFVKNTKDGTSRDLPIITLPQDKCAWSRVESDLVYCAAPEGQLAGGYPDLWYRSAVSLSDQIYSINVKTDTLKLLYSAQGDQAPDVENLVVAPDDSFIFFRNKKDGYLYQLPITGLSTGG